jgi:hypothetical protein
LSPLRLVRGRSRARIGANLSTHQNEVVPQQEANAMKTERPEPNAELQQSFEPLRTAFALAALLLGLIASLRF